MKFLPNNLAIRSWLKWPLTPVPKNWSVGAKGDVILIPGFGATWNFLLTVGNLANSCGYKVHRVKKIDINHYSIVHNLSSLKSCIEKNNLSRVILVGHSKGGIIGCLALNDKELSKSVAKVITVAAPFGGTQKAEKFQRFFHLSELRPNSRFLKSLRNLGPKKLEKIFNFYPVVDNVVIPHHRLILKGAHNFEVPVSGHTRILETSELLTALKKTF